MKTKRTMTVETIPAEILAQLTAANGKRKTRLLGSHDVESAIEELRADPAKTSVWSDGGSVANCYSYKAWTTLCLAARVDGRIHVGIGVSLCPSPSPGRAWPVLSPWGIGKPETLAAKLRLWTACSNVFPID